MAASDRMSFEDDFVLPPRATGRPPNRRDATASRSSSVASSAENRASEGRGGRSSGDRSRKKPSGNPYLEQRVLSIAAYAAELRRGGSEKLDEDQRLRIFGSTFVPIPVPLEPKETEAIHEKRFRGWIAKRRVRLEDETVASERKLRIEFARFKVRSYDAGSQRTSVTRGGKRGRAQYERDDGEHQEDEDGHYYENHHVQEEEDEEDDYIHEDDSNYRAVYAEEVQERDVRHDEDESESDETGSMTHKRRRTGASGHSADMLLRKRVLSMEQYQAELKRERVRKLTAAERVALYGTNVAPVPVPLFPGETVEEYEQAFLRYLSSCGTNAATNANSERGQRIKYARHRATEPPPTIERDEKPNILDRVGEPSIMPSVIIKSEPVDEHPKPSLAVDLPPMDGWESSAATKHFPTTCSLVCPPEGSSSTAQLRAFLACSCHGCLVQCVDRLVDRSEVAERTVKANGDAALAQPTIASDSTNLAATKGVDVAKMVHLTSLMKSRRQRQSSSASTKLGDSATREDPIEVQLVGQYDEINARVHENQLELDRIASQVQAASIGHVDATTLLQRRMQDLEGVIEDEMDHRNAALAMLAVYLWRHDKPDLVQRTTNPGASDVQHVQCVCHQKCATLAADLVHNKAQAAALKRELDALLLGDGTAAEDDRLATLQRVGEQLTRVEQAIASLHGARRREVATLVHFDAHVRELIDTLLLET